MSEDKDKERQPRRGPPRTAQDFLTEHQRTEDELLATRTTLEQRTKKLRASLETVKALEHQLQLVTDKATVMIAQCDAEQRYTFVNQPYVDHFGLPPNDVLGRTISEVLGPEPYSRIKPYIEAVLQGTRTEFELTFPGSDSNVRHLSCAYDPERDGTGRVVGWVAALTDITKRKVAEQALQAEFSNADTLDRIGRALTLGFDLQKIVQTVTDEATHLTGAQFGAFFYNVAGEDGETYMLYSVSGAELEAFNRFPMPRNTEIFEPTFRGADVVRLRDVTRDPRFGKNAPYYGLPPGHLPVKSYLAAPVIGRAGDVLGGLFFGHETAGVFRERHEQLLRGVAAQAAVAIESVRLYERLLESEERFKQLTENIREVFWMSDLEKQRVLYVSGAYKDVWGRSCDSLYKNPRSFFDAIHPDDKEDVRAHSLERQARGESSEVEYRVVRPDGSVRWIRDRSFPIRDSSDAVYRMVGIAEDITERRHAEQSFRFLADAGAVLGEVVDCESTLQRVAGLAVPTFADWCAVDLTEANGELRRLAVVHIDPDKVELAKELHEKYPPDPHTAHGAYYVLRTGEPEIMSDIPDKVLVESAHDEEHLSILRDLGLRSLICVPLLLRRKVLGVLTFVCAESGRRYESRDLFMAEELAARAATAIENARLYADLREADQRKDEFLAMLAHELRNPLAPIRTGLELLALGETNREETLALMQVQVDHLVRLVDDLLDISRIVRGRIDLRRRPAELKTIIQSSVQAVRSTIEKRQQRLRVNLPKQEVWLNADSVRLIQVIENLLNNASKYTDEGGQLEVSGTIREEKATIRVSDNGIGIEPSLLPHVFDLFTQANRSLDRSQGGLGIGLTLVRKLVELHGGEVSASSDGLDRGSHFEVVLPVDDAPQSKRESKTMSTLPSRSRRILVVDDSVGAAKTIALLIRHLGSHQIEMAHDGPTALQRATTFCPEIVLLDIGLPGMDGLQVATSMRNSGSFDATLLVALTGYGQEEDRRRSREAGFDEHIVKPMDLETLKRILCHEKLVP